MHSRPNIHPGEILQEEFLKPAGVDLLTVARDTKMPVERLHALTNGQGAVCMDTALRLALYLGTSERFWLEQQLRYDLERFRAARGRLEQEVTPLGEGSDG